MHCPRVLTYLWPPIEWLTFGQNLSTCYYFLQKKLNFHFWFFPIFGYATLIYWSAKIWTSALPFMCPSFFTVTQKSDDINSKQLPSGEKDFSRSFWENVPVVCWRLQIRSDRHTLVRLAVTCVTPVLRSKQQIDTYMYLGNFQFPFYILLTRNTYQRQNKVNNILFQRHTKKQTMKVNWNPPPRPNNENCRNRVTFFIIIIIFFFKHRTRHLIYPNVNFHF